MKTRSLPVLLFLVMFLSGSVNAQLSWDHPSQEFHPGFSETNVVAQYTFRNTGKTVIHISDVDTSCGCTTAKLDKRDYKPGEAGEIGVNFQIGDREGDQHKSIAVQSDDQTNPVMVLSLKVFIPDFATVTPNFLSWKVGDAPLPKEFEIHIKDGFPVQTVEARLESGKGFQENLLEVEKNKFYKVVITPDDTSKISGTAVRIWVNRAGPAPKKKFLFIYTESR